MNTLTGRLWVLGTVLGFVGGIYLALRDPSGVLAIAIGPLLGSMAGLLLAMSIEEVRSRFRKRANRAG